MHTLVHLSRSLVVDGFNRHPDVFMAYLIFAIDALAETIAPITRFVVASSFLRVILRSWRVTPKSIRHVCDDSRLFTGLLNSETLRFDFPRDHGLDAC